MAAYRTGHPNIMRLSQDDFESISAQLAAEMAEMVGAPVDATPFDPGKKGEPERKKWKPLHGPTQSLIMYDQSDIVGACGEKFTGKSIVFLDKIVAHCYLEFDALFAIIGNSHRALAEGVCHDLVTFTLPRWREGNRQPQFLREGNLLVPNPREGQLLDDGIGLEYTPWKSDPNNKDLYLKIRNRYGGWSRIRVIAIPFAEMVQARVTNLNASGFYLEEATRCNGDDYYKWPVVQLYRRRGIKGPQQYLFSCNPDDPENWVHPWMYKDSVVTKNEPGRDWPDDPEKPGIRRDPQVAFYYLHYEENKHNVSQKNREALKRALRSNPILRARLMESKWIAMPEGDALFKAEFEAGRHLKGDVDKKKGLAPNPGYPIVIGMDWGARSIGIVFKQIIESVDGPFDIAFDELAYYQEMHKTRQLARAILEKMRYWNMYLRALREWDEATAERGPDGRPLNVPSWCWWFITGDDATTNYNPESGNIHARDLQDHMKAILEEEPERYLGIEAPVIRGCPRPKDSVGKRVDLVAENLMSDMAIVSATCTAVRGMFFHLARDKENPSHPAKGNRWIHLFDGYSYPIYYRRFVLRSAFYNFNEGAALSVA